MAYTDEQLRRNLQQGESYEFVLKSSGGENSYLRATFLGFGEYQGRVDGREIHYVVVFLEDWGAAEYGATIWDVSRIEAIQDSTG